METAARWHAQLESGTADQSAFETWRDADPRHAAAFARIAGVADQFDRARPYVDVEPTSRRQRPPMRLAVGVAAGLFIGGVMAFAYVNISGAHKLSTTIGAEKTVILPDGTNLVLNTDTEVSWKFDRDHRSLWIQRGEIAVTVHPDGRPLSIYGGKGEVQLSQGKVNARLRNKTIDLAVLDGKARAVQADPVTHVVSDVWVPTGQGVLIAPEDLHVRSLSGDDLQFISGWQNGELVLNGQTLATVVQEYNRYLTHPIAVADPSLEGVRLGGRFSTHDPDRFLKALEEGFDIRAVRADDGAITLSK